jgi:hypothetical protein
VTPGHARCAAPAPHRSNAGAWADAIEAEVAAELARLPKNRRFPTWMQQRRLDVGQ